MSNLEAGTGPIGSLVGRNADPATPALELTEEERRNAATFLRYKAAHPSDRPAFQSANFVIRRRGFSHLPELAGSAGVELRHGSLQGRHDKIEDMIVKGDRIWAVFRLRAKHVGPLYGVEATGKELDVLETCVMRFVDGLIEECWFFGDELGLCRQLGIPVQIHHASTNGAEA
jgi:hypothetical protein